MTLPDERPEATPTPLAPVRAPDPRQGPGPDESVVGLVLAGGEGRRMGGQDKGLVDFRGLPLALHAARRLAPQVASVMISANRNLPVYRAWGWPVVADASDDRSGPLSGLLAGLQALPATPSAAADGPWLACVPCDSPGFPTDLVARLRAAAQAAGARAAVAAVPGRAGVAGMADAGHRAAATVRSTGAPSPQGGSAPPRVQPVFCLVHRCLADGLAAALARGERRMGAWLQHQGAVAVVWSDDGAFANVNTPDELQRLAAGGPGFVAPAGPA